jgi:hypothetical protein
MATSYANAGGSGNRTSIIKISAFGGTSVFPNSLIDGLTNDNVYWFPTSTGCWIQFWFASKKIIDEAKFYQGGTQTHGTWQWQGSDDATSWTNIGSTFTLGGVTTQTITTLSGNTTAYLYYRVNQTGGTTNGGPYVHEFEFKIDEGGTTSYLHSLGSGNRVGLITITSTGITWTTDANHIINGSFTGESFWNSAAVAGHSLAFNFGAAYIIQEARFYFDSSSNQGDWKFQGSNDGTTYTDLSGTITLGLGTVISGGILTTIGGFISNVTAYQHYRLLGISGNRTNGPYEKEIEFMVGDAPAPPASAVESIQFSVVRPD